MIVTRHLGLAAVTALVACTVGAAQSRADVGNQSSDLATWLNAVRTHMAGSADAPVSTIVIWPRERIRRVLNEVLPTATPDTLARALSLHTDITIVERTTPQAPASSGGRMEVELVDGREVRWVRRSFHWELSWQIASVLATRPGEGPRVAAWYRAVSAMLQQWANFGLAMQHLKHAHELFGRDPELALHQGTLHQAFADPRLQRYARAATAPRRNDPWAPFHDAPGTVETERDAAERQFRRALALDPTLHEARIRLAHVLSQQGDDRQAVEVVRPALQDALPPFVEFYAAMILGRSEERLGRYAEAGTAYDRAARLFPGAQSAAICRSRVALALGRAEDAVEMVARVTGAARSAGDDPWVSYLLFHVADAHTLLRAWRDTVE